jgi:hypothetical protein
MACTKCRFVLIAVTNIQNNERMLQKCKLNSVGATDQYGKLCLAHVTITGPVPHSNRGLEI